MTKHDALHELTKLVLACRPENMLREGAAPMMENMFSVAAEAHAFLVHHAEELNVMYGEHARDVLMALEYPKHEGAEEDGGLPLKIQYALELVREHGIYARLERGVNDA